MHKAHSSILESQPTLAQGVQEGLAFVHANLFAIAHVLHSAGADTVQKAISLKGQTNEIKDLMSW